MSLKPKDNIQKILLFVSNVIMASVMILIGILFNIMHFISLFYCFLTILTGVIYFWKETKRISKEYEILFRFFKRVLVIFSIVLILYFILTYFEYENLANILICSTGIILTMFSYIFLDLYYYNNESISKNNKNN